MFVNMHSCMNMKYELIKHILKGMLVFKSYISKGRAPLEKYCAIGIEYRCKHTESMRVTGELTLTGTFEYERPRLRGYDP